MQVTKLTLFTLALFGAVRSATAQTLPAAKVPTVVKSSFANKYPNTDGVKWEKEGGLFEASFKRDGQSVSATFQPDGAFAEYEVPVAKGELPATILPYVKEHYNGATVKETSKITKASGEINYEAGIKGMDILFDAQGKFLKAVKD